MSNYLQTFLIALVSIVVISLSLYSVQDNLSQKVLLLEKELSLARHDVQTLCKLPNITIVAPPAPVCPETQVKVPKCKDFIPSGCPGFATASITDWDTFATKPTVCHYLNLGCLHMKHLFGIVRGTGSPNGWAASHADVLFLDFLFALHPDISSITEFGTAGGVTSLFLGMIARLRQGKLHTFDYQDKRTTESKSAWLPDDMEFKQEDLLSKVNPVAVESLRRENQFAWMDNGNKAKEIEMYSEFLPIGSVLATHDWGTEIRGDQVDSVLKTNGYVPIYNDMAEMLGTHVRAWKRVKESG